MGLIKALSGATTSALGDQFKEFVTCPTIAKNVIIQKGVVNHGEGNKNPSEGIISNGSTIAVPQGMAMMIIDNGEIKEFTAEAGTFYYDTSSEPSIFTGGGTGTISKTSKGNLGRWHDHFYIPDGETKTLSELREEDREYEAKFWGTAKFDFAKWYKENKM